MSVKDLIKIDKTSTFAFQPGDSVSVSVFSNFKVGRTPIYSDGTNPEGGYYSPSCPNDLESNSKTLEVIKKVLEHKPEFLVMEELHYPSFWRSSSVKLLDSCYCSNCMSKFSSEKLFGEALPTNLQELVDVIDGSFYIDWLEFKCSVVLDMLDAVRQLVKEISPETKLCAVIPAWKEKDNGSGLKRLLGIDLDLFSQKLDFVLYDQAFQQDFDPVSYTEFLQAFGTNFLQFNNIFKLI